MQTASAMAHAHKQGVFHSDLKPQNVVYSKGSAKIIDFGVSRSLGLKSAVQHYTATLTGKVMGLTECYAPPEHCLKELIKRAKEKVKGTTAAEAQAEAEREIMKKVSGFSLEKVDIYLWGMTFYHMITKMDIMKLSDEWETYRESKKAYEPFMKKVSELRLGEGVHPKHSKAFIEMLTKCLAFMPNDRPTFDSINKEYMEEFDVLGYGSIKGLVSTADNTAMGNISFR